MRVRTATIADAPAIAAAHVASWERAYRGQLPDELLDRLDVGRRAEVWERLLGEEGRRTLVAVDDDGAVTGFVHVHAARDDDTALDTGEVAAIYAVPGVWSTGVGRELMAAGVRALAEDGFTDAVLWVLEGNQRARRFYELAGWMPDGATKDDVIGGAPVREVRYRRAL